jgi:hypothetical protein
VSASRLVIEGSWSSASVITLGFFLAGALLYTAVVEPGVWLGVVWLLEQATAATSRAATGTRRTRMKSPWWLGA